MKTKITALALIAATALTLAPKPAQAGDKELALLGGLIGGVIIGSVINDARHHDRGHRDTVIVERFGNEHCDSPDGRWEDVSVRVWVPSVWVEERGRHGRRHRHYVPGHYEYRSDRVWVSFDRHDRRDRPTRRGDYNR